MRSVLCAVAVLVAVPAFAVEASAVRKLDAQKLNVAVPAGGESAPSHSVIRSADDLGTVFLDAAGRDAVKGQVDFAKEKLVVIAWQGSSSSAAEAWVSRCGKSVRFAVVTSEPALSDLRPHVAVFAMPAEMAVEVAK
jgi:hypothetical protein